MSRFPLTARDEPQPTARTAEPSREWVNAHPENDAQRLARTRRYFRLTHRGTKGIPIALGTDPLLDTTPDFWA